MRNIFLFNVKQTGLETSDNILATDSHDIFFHTFRTKHKSNELGFFFLLLKFHISESTNKQKAFLEATDRFTLNEFFPGRKWNEIIISKNIRIFFRHSFLRAFKTFWFYPTWHESRCRKLKAICKMEMLYYTQFSIIYLVVLLIVEKNSLWNMNRQYIAYLSKCTWEHKCRILLQSNRGTRKSFTKCMNVVSEIVSVFMYDYSLIHTIAENKEEKTSIPTLQNTVCFLELRLENTERRWKHTGWRVLLGKIASP